MTSKTNKKKMLKNTSRKKCCDVTFHGLEKWYIYEFEHLGWMILAKNKNLHDKIGVYKNSLQRLKNSLENALREIKETDRKRDLKIMHKNLLVLIDHVNKDF